MGTDKRKVRILLIAAFVCVIFDCCLAQHSVDILQVNKLIATRDSAVDARFEENLNYFRESGQASTLVSDPDYYKRLKSYSKEIRDRVFPCYKGCKSSSYNRQVLGLLDLPEYMKDSLLNFKYTELEVRAGLGDTAAQREVYNKFQAFIQRDNKTSDEVYQYLHKEKLPVILLAYMGTNESIQVYLKGMNSTDIYEDTESGNKGSVFGTLLGNYSAYYGGSVITNSVYYDRFLYTEEGALGKDYQEWLRELEQYFEDRHGLKLNIQAPYLIQGYEYYPEH